MPKNLYFAHLTVNALNNNEYQKEIDELKYLYYTMENSNLF
jgi:hypothetical protein